MNLIKTIARRPIRRFLERSVAKLIKANPELKVVAIGGSVGKTSTKFATATVLGQARRVLTNHSNYNSEFGLPLAIFELHAPAKVTDTKAWLAIIREVRAKLTKPFPYDMLVVELGTDKPGDIAAFMRYLTPDIGIVTAITPEHMEFFGTLDAVGVEEFTLDLHARNVVLHAADPELARRRDQLSEATPIMTYGEGGEIYWAGDSKLRLGDGVKETITVTSPLLGEHLRLALLAAAAIGVQMGLTPDQIQDGVNAVQPVAGRMQRLVGKHGTVIIDDTYNSSPDAAIAALETLAAMPGLGRRIALLGQMNELGAYSKRAHEEVGRAATKLDDLVTLAGDANTILGPAAIEAGLAADKVHAFDSPYAAGEWLEANLQSGDIILIKGSQNRVFAEEAIKPLLKDVTDAQYLVRQSSDWMTKKAAQFPDAPKQV